MLVYFVIVFIEVFVGDGWGVVGLLWVVVIIVLVGVVGSVLLMFFCWGSDGVSGSKSCEGNVGEVNYCSLWVVVLVENWCCDVDLSEWSVGGEVKGNYV